MPASSTSLETVAALMGRFRQGDSSAVGQLVDLFYPELRRLAADRMKSEGSDHTWQPTVLVHELYLEMVQIKALRPAEGGGGAERAEFFRIAAFLMRRLLIHHARPMSRRAIKEELSDFPDPRTSGSDSLLQVDDALRRLAGINPQLRTVVELRVFEGLTGEQIAERLGCGLATVTRRWNFAREWLAEEFDPPTAA